MIDRKNISSNVQFESDLLDITSYSKKGITQTKIQEIKKIFDIFDANGNGSINPKTLKEAINVLGLKLQENELPRILDKFDIDSDGQLNFKEFLEMMIDCGLNTQNLKDMQKTASIYSEKHPISQQINDNLALIREEENTKLLRSLPKQKLEKLQTVFKSFADNDSSTHITPKELSNSFISLKHELTRLEIYTLINELDRDGDGLLSFHEFLRGIVLKNPSYSHLVGDLRTVVKDIMNGKCVISKPIIKGRASDLKKKLSDLNKDLSIDMTELDYTDVIDLYEILDPYETGQIDMKYIQDKLKSLELSENEKILWDKIIKQATEDGLNFDDFFNFFIKNQILPKDISSLKQSLKLEIEKLKNLLNNNNSNQESNLKENDEDEDNIENNDENIVEKSSSSPIIIGSSTTSNIINNDSSELITNTNNNNVPADISMNNILTMEPSLTFTTNQNKIQPNLFLRNDEDLDDDDIEDLESFKSFFEQKLKQVKEKRNESIKKNVELKEINKKLQEELKIKDSKLNESQQELSRMKEKLISTQKQLGNLEKGGKTILPLDNSNSIASNKLDNSRKVDKSKAKNTEDHKFDNEIKLKDIDDYKQLLLKKDKEIEDLKSKIQCYLNKNEEWEIKRTNLQNNLNRFKLKEEEYIQEKDKLLAEYNKLLNTINDRDIKIKNIENELNSKIMKYKKKLDKKREENVKLDYKNKEQEELLKELRQELYDKEKLFQDEVKSSKQIQENLEETIFRLYKEKESICDQMDVQKNDNLSLIEEKKNLMEEYEYKLNDANKQLDDLKSEYEKYVHQYETHIKECSCTIEKLTYENDKLIDKMNQNDLNNNADYEAKIKIYEQNIQDNRDIIHKLTISANDLKKKVEILAKSFEHSIKIIDSIKPIQNEIIGFNDENIIEKISSVNNSVDILNNESLKKITQENEYSPDNEIVILKTIDAAEIILRNFVEKFRNIKEVCMKLNGDLKRLNEDNMKLRTEIENLQNQNNESQDKILNTSIRLEALAKKLNDPIRIQEDNKIQNQNSLLILDEIEAKIEEYITNDSRSSNRIHEDLNKHKEHTKMGSAPRGRPEVEHLKERITKMELEIAELQQTMKIREDENSTIQANLNQEILEIREKSQKDHEEYENLIKEKTAENEGLQNELETTRKTSDEFKMILAEKENDLKDVKSLLEETNNRLTANENSYKNLESLANKANAIIIENLQQQQQEGEEGVHETTLLSNLKSLIEKHNTECTNLKKNHADVLNKLKDQDILERENNSLNESINSQKKIIEENERLIHEKDLHLQDLNQNINSLQEKIDELDNQLNEKEILISNNIKEQLMNNELLTKLEKEIVNKEEEISTLRKNIEYQSISYDEKINDLESKINAYQDNISKKDNELHRIQEELEINRAHLQEKETHILENIELINSMKTEFNLSEEYLGEYLSTNTKKHYDITKSGLTNSIVSLKALMQEKISNLENELLSTNEALFIQKQELTMKESQISDLQNFIEEINYALKEKSNELEIKQIQLKDMIDEKENLLSERNELLSHIQQKVQLLYEKDCEIQKIQKESIDALENISQSKLSEQKALEEGFLTEKKALEERLMLEIQEINKLNEELTHDLQEKNITYDQLHAKFLENANNNEEINMLNKEIEDLKHIINQKDEKISHLKFLVDESNEKLAVSTKAINDLKKEDIEMKIKTADFHDQLYYNKIDNDSLKKELERLKKAHDILEKELQEYKNPLPVGNSETDHKSQNNDLENIKIELNDLKQIFSIYKSNNKKENMIKNNREEVKAKIKSLKSMYNLDSPTKPNDFKISSLSPEKKAAKQNLEKLNGVNLELIGICDELLILLDKREQELAESSTKFTNSIIKINNLEQYLAEVIKSHSYDQNIQYQQIQKYKAKIANLQDYNDKLMKRIDNLEIEFSQKDSIKTLLDSLNNKELTKCIGDRVSKQYVECLFNIINEKLIVEEDRLRYKFEKSLKFIEKKIDKIGDIYERTFHSLRDKLKKENQTIQELNGKIQFYQIKYDDMKNVAEYEAKNVRIFKQKHANVVKALEYDYKKKINALSEQIEKLKKGEIVDL